MVAMHAYYGRYGTFYYGEQLQVYYGRYANVNYVELCQVYYGRYAKSTTWSYTKSTTVDMLSVLRE